MVAGLINVVEVNPARLEPESLLSACCGDDCTCPALVCESPGIGCEDIPKHDPAQRRTARMPSLDSACLPVCLRITSLPSSFSRMSTKTPYVRSSQLHYPNTSVNSRCAISALNTLHEEAQYARSSYTRERTIHDSLTSEATRRPSLLVAASVRRPFLPSRRHLA